MRERMSSSTGKQVEQAVLGLDKVLDGEFDGVTESRDGGKSKDSRGKACIDHKTSLIGIETSVM